MNVSSSRSRNRQLVAIAGLVFVFTSSIPLHAQTPATGFFKFVNAVPSPNNTVVTVDGKPLRPDGFKTGHATGALGFAAGVHQVAAMLKDYKPAAISLQVSPSTSPTVVAYAVDVQQPGGQIARELRLFARQNRPPAGKKSYSIVYVGRAPSVDVEIDGPTRTLKALDEVALGTNTHMTIISGGQTVGEIGSEGAGHHVVILFDSLPLGLGSVTTSDRVYTRAGAKAP